jgi:hypothetical protein
VRHIITFVDVETTGFDNPAPIEIAAMRLTPAWTVERAFYRRWQPSKPVEPDAARINGYNERDWQGCEPVTEDDLRAFSAFVAGSQWAGSHPDFDYGAMEPNRVGARLPEWHLATHRRINVGSNGGPLIEAVGGTSGGQAAILEALAKVGRPVPPMPEWLVDLARGRIGVHSAMGDAWSGAWALRHLWTEAEEYWRGQLARAA